MQIHGRHRYLDRFDANQHLALARAHRERAATFGPVGFGQIGRIRLVPIHGQLHGEREALDDGHVLEVAVFASEEAHLVVARSARQQLVEQRQRREGRQRWRFGGVDRPYDLIAVQAIELQQQGVRMVPVLKDEAGAHLQDLLHHQVQFLGDGAFSTVLDRAQDVGNGTHDGWAPFE